MNWLTPTLILEFIIGLTLLIIIHELGHFLVARMLKIEVEEFGIGFPPRIIRLFKLAGTEFTLNWILLGGFVRPKGDNDPSIPGGLASANPWKRLAVYFAGPTANLLTGAILFTLVFAKLGSIPDPHTILLNEVTSGSPAEIAGLKAGDIIFKANDQTIRSTEQLRNIIYDHLGEPFEIVYIRDGQEISVIVTPRANPTPDQGALGIIMGTTMKPFTWSSGIAAGFDQIREYTRALGDLVGKLLQGQATATEAGVMGVVGMGEFYIEMRQSEPVSGVPKSVNSLAFFATISVSLGLLNLFPIPALDGGRIVLTLPELIIGRRVPPKYENILNGISFVVLLILLLFVNARDVFNIFTR